MLNKVINKIKITIEANSKSLYDIETSIPYNLKVGDRIYNVNYENRGIVWNNAKILDVNNECITITDCWLSKDKVFRLLFNEEPSYSKIFSYRYDNYDYIIPERRKLEIYPFPAFKEGFKIKNLKEFKKLNEDIFIKEDLMHVDLNKYLNNFRNIIADKQVSMFST